MGDRERLKTLLQAGHSCIFIRTFEEADALLLATQTFASIEREFVVWSNSDGLRDGLVKDAPSTPETEHPAAALYDIRRRSWGANAVLLDLGMHLKDSRTLRELRETIQHAEATDGRLVLIDHEQLPEVIRAYATPFEMTLPDEKEIERIICETVKMQHQAVPITTELTRRTLDVMIRNLSGLTRRQVRQIVLDAICDDRRLDASDINRMLASKRQMLGGNGLLEFVETPIGLEEIGGLKSLKAWLRHRTGALSAEARAFGIAPPRGVLMLGVQGAGKSLAAKAVSTAWQRPLLRLDPAVLFDRYIGESERRLCDALHQAEAAAPLILWIDEIEKGFASATAQSVDGGLSKRMFGSLLTWMQEHTSPVFLIATANDIESLPPELLRKGRFDEIFFVDLPDAEARVQIFSIHLKKRQRNPGAFDLPALAAAADGYSGSEIEQAILAALYDAFNARQELRTETMLNALRRSPPLSVTMAERMAALRSWAAGRCVPADE